MTSASKPPVLFISHGAPTFAIEPGRLGPALQQLGQQLPPLKAVLVVSPHWQTNRMTVMTTVAPETVHDFGGFPASLYRLQYPVAGHPDMASEAAGLLTASGFAAQFDERRGLDHGAWVPLTHLLPQANLPVFQVSMPFNLSTSQAFHMVQALAPLRERGVLIVTSGSMTHNLYELRQLASAAQAYAQEFAGWIKTAVMADAVSSLIQYRSEAPHAERAHPTQEHFLPLLVALGAKGDGDAVQFLEGGVTHGVLSMDSYAWGMPLHT